MALLTTHSLLHSCARSRVFFDFYLSHNCTLLSHQALIECHTNPADLGICFLYEERDRPGALVDWPCVPLFSVFVYCVTCAAAMSSSRCLHAHTDYCYYTVRNNPPVWFSEPSVTAWPLTREHVQVNNERKSSKQKHKHNDKNKNKHSLLSTSA